MNSEIESAFSPPPPRPKVTNLEFMDDLHGVWKLLETWCLGVVSREEDSHRDLYYYCPRTLHKLKSELTDL